MNKHKWSNEEIKEYRKVHDGGFYFNPQDTRVTVPKMFGIGFTFNWANPLSWVAIVAILAFIVCAKYLFVH